MAGLKRRRTEQGGWMSDQISMSDQVSKDVGEFLFEAAAQH
jgi:hypothetical protein